MIQPPKQGLIKGLEVNQSMMDQFVEQVKLKSKSKILDNDRQLQVDEVESAVVYLLSTRSSFLNGINLVIDGGKTL